MLMFDYEDRVHRADVHPLAAVETEHPITECETCGLPVPMEAGDSIYCNKACEDVALSQALLESEIEACMQELPPPLPLDCMFSFSQLFPEVASRPEPTIPHVFGVCCSCC